MGYYLEVWATTVYDILLLLKYPDCDPARQILKMHIVRARE